jgi:uncharacterized protein YdaT
LSYNRSMRDIELLGVLSSNDSSQFNRIIARLKCEAKQIANEIDGLNVEEAVSIALDKAIDWLKSDTPSEVNHPVSYAIKLVHNAVIDYGKTNIEKAMPEDQIKRDLAWIDETMGYFGEDENDEVDDKRAGTGVWHGIKVRRHVLGQDILKLPVIYSPEHGWLRALRPENLYRCADWFFAGGRETDRSKRWGKYKLIMALIDNIPSLSEQETVKCYLWGYRITDIAREFDVSKAYISKVITKWMESWGWDKEQRDRARIILLIKFLAYSFLQVAEELYRNKQSRYLPLRHLTTREAVEWICRDRNWAGCFNEAADILYQKIIKAPQTRAYFSNLQKSDNIGLLEACRICCWYWYPFLIFY